MNGPTLPVTVTVSEDDGEALQQITNRGVKANGVELRLTSWDGWDDTAEIRGNPEPVPAGDGDYDDGPLLASRVLTMKGVALADTPADLMAIGRVFRRLLVGENRQGTVVVDQNDEESLQSSIRLNGKTVFDKTHPTRAEWSMSLYAADSRRYSTDLKTDSTQPFAPSGGLAFNWAFPLSFGAGGAAGTITVTNDGDIPTGVLLDIVGACVNPQIHLVETGQRIALIDTIDADVVIDTNTRNRSVLRNGSPYGWVLTSDSEFFQLPKGTSTLLFSVDSGNPTLTASWRDATP